MREIRQGQFYRHFKDRLYQVVAIAEHSETGEKMVVYQALYGDYRTYVRPYDMFASEVDHEKYPQVTQRYRFELVEMPGQADPVKKEEAFAEPVQKSVPEEPKEVKPVTEDTEDEGVNPILLEFLDADTLEEKMHLMTFYRNKMDENLLNNIAISLDVVVEKEDIQGKYDEIMNCLSMMERFECNRFR
jgi:hypothetical protein